MRARSPGLFVDRIQKRAAGLEQVPVRDDPAQFFALHHQKMMKPGIFEDFGDDAQ
jgi:hypothetical protein